MSLSNYKLTSIDGMDGYKFEHFCAEILKMNGFSNIRITPASRDQGVDILANKDGIRYAIQCKNYSNPLGNKSVQEVNAGKIFYDCHVGVVMTNSTFTSSATELAEKTGVLLWNRDKLKDFIKNASTSQSIENRISVLSFNYDNDDLIRSYELEVQKKEKEWDNKYFEAISILNNAHDIAQLKKAITLFETIPNWKDSREKIKECQEKMPCIDDIVSQEKKSKIYSEATNILYNANNTTQLKKALTLLESIHDWKDSEEKIKECQNQILYIEKLFQQEKLQRRKAMQEEKQ